MQSQIEDSIYKAMMRVGVNVDADELMKALEHDRDQYQKGYKERDEEIVRCKDCRWAEVASRESPIIYDCSCPYHQLDSAVYGDWFCADGERKEGR